MTRMFYDETLNRWMVDVGGSVSELHCGECFDLVIGGEGIPCRLELGRHWFLVMQDVRLNLRTQDTYQIILF